MRGMTDLSSQLRVLIEVANRDGLYEAADFLKSRVASAKPDAPPPADPKAFVRSVLVPRLTRPEITKLFIFLDEEPAGGPLFSAIAEAAQKASPEIFGEVDGGES